MPYIHCVYFTCRQGTSPADIAAQTADATALLARIPSALDVTSGLRDETVNRDVSDTDYDIGLVVSFDDKQGYDAYSSHPLHLEYISKHKGKWAKVRVYDFVAD